ncbi:MULTISPECIES: hypothetical protein [Desulfovibrio]|uniref:Uncharacterized protein n=1 Tax=Desulfovibrio desulfuricans TaxID=876 RepID=A0AA94L1C9_DESDE|nr:MULTISPECIES: hypothetical protein [Desulfovibrio]SFW24191.1 hypothetical protein SAMN02910291_00536 [Desulfovibrio desulfuricans]SPD36697.1 Hypothetical protein DSVG11_2663 [Desulfovibrio sp. G11]
MSAPTPPSTGDTPDINWPQWPQWMEDARLDDSLAATAYEETPPSWRAAIKTGLALAHMHFGSSAGHGCETQNNDRLGFWREHENHAAAWTVIAFPPSYAAAARLAAACISPILADVPLVGAVCIGGTPHSSALVSLELSGVEDIFVLDVHALHALLEQCGPGPGRLLLLHTGELELTAAFARTLGLPCWEEAHPPTLILPPAEPGEISGTCTEARAFDPKVLAFAQAGANFVQSAPTVHPPFSENAGQDTPPHGASALHAPAQDVFLPNATERLLPAAGMIPSKPDAQYVSSGHARHAACCRKDGALPCAPLLTLTPGCEGFWLHPGLTPDFFRVHSLAFGLL